MNNLQSYWCQIDTAKLNNERFYPAYPSLLFCLSVKKKIYIVAISPEWLMINHLALAKNDWLDLELTPKGIEKLNESLVILLRIWLAEKKYFFATHQKEKYYEFRNFFLAVNMKYFLHAKNT